MPERIPPHEHTPQTLYRGLRFTGSREELADPEGFVARNLNMDQMGIHWTSNPNSAYNFAQDRDPEGWAHEADPWGDEDDDTHAIGAVVQGRVYPRHVLQHGSQEWEDYAMSDQILDPEHPEQETTVRDKGIVHVEKIHITDDEDTHLGTTKPVRPWGRA